MRRDRQRYRQRSQAGGRDLRTQDTQDHRNTGRCVTSQVHNSPDLACFRRCNMSCQCGNARHQTPPQIPQPHPQTASQQYLLPRNATSIPASAAHAHAQPSLPLLTGTSAPLLYTTSHPHHTHITPAPRHTTTPIPLPTHTHPTTAARLACPCRWWCGWRAPT